MPSITQLEYALAVDQHRHFGRASAACGISQPTLSLQLGKLEDELGIMLFDRHHKPIVPTPSGIPFLEQARTVVREYQRLQYLAGRQKGGAPGGPFRLGIIPTISSHLLPLFIGRQSQSFSAVELTIEELKTESIIEALNHDRLDGAILATPLNQSGFKEHVLYYEEFYLYCSQGHPLLKKKSIRVEDLDGSEMWMLKDGHCFKNQVVNFCSIDASADSVFRNIHFQGGSLETLRNLVKRHRGYTMIPSLMLGQMEAAERRDLVRPFGPLRPTREVSFVYRRDHWKLEIIRGIEDSIRASLPSDVSLKRLKHQEVLEIC